MHMLLRTIQEDDTSPLTPLPRRIAHLQLRSMSGTSADAFSSTLTSPIDGAHAAWQRRCSTHCHVAERGWRGLPNPVQGLQSAALCTTFPVSTAFGCARGASHPCLAVARRSGRCRGCGAPRLRRTRPRLRGRARRRLAPATPPPSSLRQPARARRPARSASRCVRARIRACAEASLRRGVAQPIGLLCVSADAVALTRAHA